jgi:lipid-A-disaccharide synthase
MHAFEVPYYEPYGLPVTVIGQPALARSKELDGQDFRERYGLSDEDDLLLVLPGSRRAEIALVAPVLIHAARLIARQSPNVKVCIAPAKSVLVQFKEMFPDLPSSWILLEDEGSRYEGMAAAKLAISCSGTVNTELAVQRTPFITGYKIGAISWILLKTFFFKAKFITLVNMAADKMVAREYLQSQMTVKAISGEALRLLRDGKALEAQIQAQDAALAKMGFGERSAQSLSAEAILADLNI